MRKTNHQQALKPEGAKFVLALEQDQFQQLEVIFLERWQGDTMLESSYTGYCYHWTPRSDREQSMINCMWELAEIQRLQREIEQREENVNQFGFSEEDLMSYMKELGRKVA